ncbi:hypothetical protein ATK36_4269 [Amycolatopsis sulphurea]|uniref:Uncharacterized protein n=1 Tax=Amycolatopsis sulphurea TaxID=76022 RepID=A0A2A9FFF1_9PSEU|nr:hypothetical protein ATK36_4269 [Amycolatopsis sulphurea]
MLEEEDEVEAGEDEPGESEDEEEELDAGESDLLVSLFVEFEEFEVVVDLPESRESVR